MVDSILTVPNFPRLEEYASIWLMEPMAFRAYWEAAQKIDLDAHIRNAPAIQPGSYETVPARNGSSVAVVKALGTLMKQRPSLGGTSTIDLRRQIRGAAADPNISGILLTIDSPGGTVSGTDDLARDIKAARRKKPIWAHIDDLGASAAYWLASQADVVYANSPTALVGSIGTIMTIYDVSAAAERDGIRALVFATGALKGAGARGTPVTEEQAAYFQSLVNASQESFDEAVRKGRGLTAAQLQDVRSGAIYPAPLAQEKRLIDGIRSLDATIEALARG